MKAGDLIAIVWPSGIEHFLAALAITKLGATPLPLSYALPRLELATVLELARPAFVIGDDKTKVLPVEVLSAEPPSDPSVTDAPLPDIAAATWFATTSGGSTGRPKVVVNTSPATTDPTAPIFEMRTESVVIVTGPLYHGGPFAYSMRAATWGCHVVLTERFEAERCVDEIARHGVEYMLAVPTVLHRIVQLGKPFEHFDLSSLRTVVTLGGACPEWLKRWWIDRLGAEGVHEFYSCTERIGSTWITGTEWLAHPGSVGRATRGSRIRIIGPDGTDQPAGVVGEIYMMPAGGPGSTYRYIGAEPRRREDGWESCGDLGWLDEDGYLYIADRRTDLIVSGGANVYPAEVEIAIDQFPGVETSAVIGLPDDELGQRVHAVVETQASLGEEDLRSFLGERLVRYKVPRTFEFVATPLRNDAGKMNRSALRASRVARTRSEQ